MLRANALRTRVLVGQLALVCGAWLVASGARALSCTTAADCPEHFTCETVGTTACDAPRECPAGQTCPTPSTCEPTEIKACKSPACLVDGDCPANMVCVAETGLQCRVSIGPEGSRDAGCEDVTVGNRTCTPRYVPPCTKASDCGDGFSCEEVVSVSCSGSGPAGTGAADGGQAPAEQCTTNRTGVFHCQLQQMACESASSCPSGFSCEANPSRAVCKSVAQSSASGEDGGAIAGDCPDAGGPAKVCLPPYYNLAFAGTDETKRSSSAGAADAGTYGGIDGGGTNGVYDINRGFWRHDHGCACSVGPGGAGPGVAFGQLGFLGLAFGALWARRRRR